MQAALARASWREAQGAINIDRLDSDVRVDNPESWDARISFLPETTGPSRSLVAEMMIMAGEIAACMGAPPGCQPLLCLKNNVRATDMGCMGSQWTGGG